MVNVADLMPPGETIEEQESIIRLSVKKFEMECQRACAARGITKDELIEKIERKIDRTYEIERER